MDLRSQNAGLPRDYFWNRSKLNLIEVLFGKIKTINLRREGKKILIVGAGTGDDLSVIRKYGKMYIIDVNPRAINNLSDQACEEKKVCNACDIEYPDNYFDIAVAFDALEHIENDNLAVKEINRVLRPGGTFLFTVPAVSKLYGSHDRYLKHYRRYDMKHINKILFRMERKVIAYWMFLLFLPIVFKKIINRKGSKIVYTPLPKSVNTILYLICKFETYLIKRGFCSPIGTTIYGIYEKTRTVKTT